MDLSVAIARSVSEMYGEIDRHFSSMGVNCRSVDPKILTNLTWFDETNFPDLLFFPISCLEIEPDREWLTAFQEAASEKGTHVAWIMSDSEKQQLSDGLETVLVVSDIGTYITAIGEQFGVQARAHQPTVESTQPPLEEPPKSEESSGLFSKVRKWAESVASGEPLGTGSSSPKSPVGPKDETRVERRPLPPTPKPRGESARESIRNSDDAGVLRDYINLKEEEIKDLRTHIQVFEDENQKLFKEVEYLKNEKNVLDRKVDTLRGRMLFLEEENEKLRKNKKDELEALRAEYKNKMERLTMSEDTLREQELKFEDLRERVRNDLFSIQERERYLEARMEILKRDTEILLHQKDERILELQEKIKQMEFKNESFQENLNRYKEMDREEQDRSQRIIRALKLATSLLDPEEEKGADGDIRKRKA